MKQYIITIILALCLASCSQHSKHWETLAQIESYIEESPDSALNVLQGMDKGEFSGMEEKAKYALLMSIALDKNWVDVTEETLINEAVDYYSNSDDIESLFKAYFYQGRIYVNARFINAPFFVTTLNSMVFIFTILIEVYRSLNHCLIFESI